MKFLRYTFLATVLLCNSLTNAAEYKTAQEGLQAITSAHVTAFSVDNLLSSGMPKEGEGNWTAALNGIEKWINKLLIKERSLGDKINQKNQDLIQNSLAQIRVSTHDLITTINALRAANFNFEQSHYADINLDALKLQVEQLQQRAQVLRDLQKSLAPGILDASDTKDIKKLLKNIAFILEQTYIKVDRDFKNLRPVIYTAINMRKYGNKS